LEDVVPQISILWHLWNDVFLPIFQMSCTQVHGHIFVLPHMTTIFFVIH
jgi:hypothetical protein